MGRIRTKDFKRATWKIAEAFPDLFTENFKTNKEILKEKGLVYTKKHRNKIAGYLVRVIRQQKTKEIK